MCSKFSTASGAKRSDNSYEIGGQDGGNVWSIVTKEAESLIQWDKNVSGFLSPSICS